MSKDLNIGQIIITEQHRDAIHVAVAPVEAGEMLGVGDHVYIKDGKAFCTFIEPKNPQDVGIVDPFLPYGSRVDKGERFWLFLYPGSVTSLRHEWEHPAFGDRAQGNKQESEAWLRRYVQIHCPYYEEFKHEHPNTDGYESFLSCVRDEKQICYYGSDCHSLEEVHDAEELFKHLSVVLGMNITAEYFESFTCSC